MRLHFFHDIIGSLMRNEPVGLRTQFRDDRGGGAPMPIPGVATIFHVSERGINSRCGLVGGPIYAEAATGTRLGHPHVCV